jgi:hypothetical protein
MTANELEFGHWKCDKLASCLPSNTSLSEMFIVSPLLSSNPGILAMKDKAHET